MMIVFGSGYWKGIGRHTLVVVGDGAFAFSGRLQATRDSPFRLVAGLEVGRTPDVKRPRNPNVKYSIHVVM